MYIMHMHMHMCPFGDPSKTIKTCTKTVTARLQRKRNVRKAAGLPKKRSELLQKRSKTMYERQPDYHQKSEIGNLEL